MAMQTDAEELRKSLIRATFNAAAPQFDAEPLFFWDHLGQRTVELAGVTAGHHVLDVCCGAGASALPAAALAGPTGHVLGVDLAEQLLERARLKADRLGLRNTEFARGDMERLDVPGEAVDVVVCVLGIYFARDLPAALAGLWRTLRPGGTLAVTTWGSRALEPANSLYLEAAAEQLPSLNIGGTAMSWERMNSPELLGEAFLDAGLPAPTILEEVVVRPVTVADFWQVVLGSGYRLLLELMGPAASERVRQSFFRQMEAHGVREVVADVQYARARKEPAPPE